MMEEILARFTNAPFEGFITLLQEHEVLASILIQFFGGDLAIHMFGVLNGSGDISFTPIVIALAVIFFFDIVIYCTVQALKQSGTTSKYLRNIRFLTKIERFFKRNEERYNTSPTLLLIAIKLMPLSKLTLIFFALSQKISTLQFIVRGSIISIVWFILLFIPGWLVGKGLLSQETGIQTSNFILYFALVVIALILFGKKIDHILMRGVDKIANKLHKNKDMV